MSIGDRAVCEQKGLELLLGKFGLGTEESEGEDDYESCAHYDKTICEQKGHTHVVV